MPTPAPPEDLSKLTVRVPAPLLRRTKYEALRRSTSVQALVTEGLTHVLANAPKPPRATATSPAPAKRTSTAKAKAPPATPSAATP